VTSRQKNSTRSFSLADDMASGWCAENTLMTDNELLHAICRSHFGDGLRNLLIPVSTITPDNQCAAIDSFWDCQEDTGNERLAVVVLLKDFDFLAETRSVTVSI
jgi:hypothetical protein